VCVEEFEGARESAGVVGALAFVSGLVAIILVGMVILLILGALALAFLPLAAVIGLVTLLISRAGRSRRGVGKSPPTDLWLE
jgi:predicted lipid-binding transport protein (Tim44 family)